MAEVKKKPRNLIAVVVLLAVVISGAVISGIFMLTEMTLADVTEKLEKHEEFIVELDSFTVNLSEDGGAPNYLKTQISLMYTDEGKTEILTTKTSQIRDIIIEDLMEYTAQKLLETGGLDTVKEKLLSDINTALGEGMVEGIYFTDFLIQ